MKPEYTLLVKPVVVDDDIFRIVKFTDGSGETQMWTGNSWEPVSNAPMPEILATSHVGTSAKTLLAYGLPESEIPRLPR